MTVKERQKTCEQKEQVFKTECEMIEQAQKLQERGWDIPKE